MSPLVRLRGAAAFIALSATACGVKAPAGPDRPNTSEPRSKTPSPEPDVRARSLVNNGGFERALDGWQPLWMRDRDRGLAEVVTEPHHGGKTALRVEHLGDKDWSLTQEREISVVPGEVFDFVGFVKTVGVTDRVTLSVVTKRADGSVLDWFWGEKHAGGSRDWQQLTGHFMVPRGCATLGLRITGVGPGTSFWDDIVLSKRAKPWAPRSDFEIAEAGTRVHYDSAADRIVLSFADGASVRALEGFGSMTGLLSSRVESVRPSKAATGQTPARAALDLFDPNGGTLHAGVGIETNGDVTFSIEGPGKLDERFEFPGALAAQAGEQWVLPINEGLLVPAGDPAFEWSNAYALFSGHGFSMPFIGVTDGTQGLVMIAETPDDAMVVTEPVAGASPSSSAAFGWLPSRGAWRYERRVRVRAVHGGYVEIAKAYREYAKARGLVVTLDQKARDNPNVDDLIGAANVWWWKDGPRWTPDPNPERVASALKKAGLLHVLWSNGGSPNALRAIRALGWLTGRYDIVQDVWSPDTPLAWVSHEGWPDGLVLEADGNRMRGWVARDGDKHYTGGVICSQYGLAMLDRRVRSDLDVNPYQARFLDTTTASPLRECYNTAHPLSRSDDRRFKLEQLELLSKQMRLVTGSETGMDLAVPVVDYFEGMMSLGPYRLADAGYDLFSVRPPSPGFSTFQVGPRYRIPLFELVYHDCVVSYWYWGDASNRVAEAWDARDLFNALYATPPLYVLDEARLAEQRDRLVQSYRRATTTARRLGKVELLSHEFLDSDHLVQRTRFAGGAEVIANFGNAAVTMPGGVRLASRDYVVRFLQ